MSLSSDWPMTGDVTNSVVSPGWTRRQTPTVWSCDEDGGGKWFRHTLRLPQDLSVPAATLTIFTRRSCDKRCLWGAYTPDAIYDWDRCACSQDAVCYVAPVPSWATLLHRLNVSIPMPHEYWELHVVGTTPGVCFSYSYLYVYQPIISCCAWPSAVSCTANSNGTTDLDTP